MSQTGTPAGASMVRFARLSQRGLLLGLSASRVACIGAAAALATIAVFVAGLGGLAVTGPVWAGLLGLAFVRRGGRPIVELLPTAVHYGLRHLHGQRRYRVHPGRARPAGTMGLPGDGAALRFLLDETTGAAVVHDPHEATLTVVAHVDHAAYLLLSPEEQRRRVTGWSRVLAGLAASGQAVRVQVLERVCPDSGDGILGWWHQSRVEPATDEAAWATDEYQCLLRTYTPAAATHRSLVAIAVKAPPGRLRVRGGKSLDRLRQEMGSLEASLRAADLRLVGWLDTGALAATIRAAYDPTARGGQGRSLACAGPVAIDEDWDWIRHDTGYSCVLWVSEWPRTDVPADFLHALIFQPGITRALSITATPLSARQAIRDIRRAKVEHVTDAAQRARIGAIADLADAAELDDVLDRERALLAGHADLKFTGLITLTAASLEQLEDAIAQVERAAIGCGCETRRLQGQQARAFTAAALPLARPIH
ncbi:SCO6880 family protein [Intrasporangium sp.]|uniref:SCO6880 family protein n=1 Tax=Intrasporangium sp. TaxID=1925024 RepID=UPI0032217DA8